MATLETLRRASGLSMAALAGRIGVNYSEIVRWELGQRSIPDKHRGKLAEVFSVPVNHDYGTRPHQRRTRDSRPAVEPTERRITMLDLTAAAANLSDAEIAEIQALATKRYMAVGAMLHLLIQGGLAELTAGKVASDT